MPDFLIERVMPGVGALDVDDLKATSRLSWALMKEQFPAIEWLQSYATDDTLYCIYRAPDEAVVRDGQVVIRPIVNLVLTCDHRAIDGADGATFLQTLVSLVERPALAL